MRRGEYRSALVPLDSAIRQLSGCPDEQLELARAYLYLGAAYSEIGEESLARSRFLRALDLDPDLAERHVDAIRGLAAAARSSLASASEEHHRLVANQAGAKRKSWVGLALLGGGGAAAGAVLALAREEKTITTQQVQQSTAERSNRPPQGTIHVEPTSPIMACLTDVRIAASVSDPDGEPLRYEWDFGDGGTATGRVVQHRFASGGAKQVTLQVFDGLTSTTITTNVSVKPLMGRWRLEQPSFFGLNAVQLDQVFPASCSGDGVVIFRARGEFGGDLAPDASEGFAARPKHFEFSPYWTGRYFVYFSGDVGSTLDTMSGTLFVHPSWGTCGTVCGQSEPVTLLREQ
jgi:hypothetical protein